jgi:glycosyltransferase involved in cell wall biosynthesis
LTPIQSDSSASLRWSLKLFRRRYSKHTSGLPTAPVPIAEVARTARLLRIGSPVAKIIARRGVRRLALRIIGTGRGTALWRRMRQNPQVRHFAESVRTALARERLPLLPARRANAATGSQNGTSLSIPALYVPPAGLLPWCNPLAVEASPELASRPSLNVLLPSLAMKHMTGGPNTAINLAYRLAALGIRVRLVSADVAIDADPTAFLRHVRALTGIEAVLPNIALVDASDRERRLAIGENDLFLATAWWTAQMAKYALPHTRHRRFLYLIQDYETLLHPSSTQSALAEETYRLDHIPIVNTSLLRDFLAAECVGRFADPGFAASAIVFEPAIDRSRFRPEPIVRDPTRPRRRILVYARPSIAPRNAFEMGIAALQKLIAEGRLDPKTWEFLGMGEPFAPIGLGGGAQLMPAPWLDLDGYARQMRQSDVLLSPMISPHPSYPPLEMAACGRPVVTTTYRSKTAQRLAAISPNIIGVEPTIEALADGLVEAVERDGRTIADPPFAFPQSWSESFAETIPAVYEACLDLLGAPPLPSEARLESDLPARRLFPGYRHWPGDRYNTLRFDLLRERRAAYADAQAESGLVSLLTPVWNTPAAMLAELAESVFGQDCGPGFEWILLDNGSERSETRDLLASLAGRSGVRSFRVESNLGIIGGMRYCLGEARNRYILPLDSDDLLTPDCIRVLTAELAAADYPALAYTDEDKLRGIAFLDPYSKPDWDPVLFIHSCYIAHLTAIDRRLALELGAYTDGRTNGSHDWDTFVRFVRAGHVPHHVSHILYSWRMHDLSTAGDIASKDYIASSHLTVLGRFLAGVPHRERYRVAPSPAFNGTPDWRILRIGEIPSIPTIVIGHAANARRGTAPGQTAAAGIEHVAAKTGIEGLLRATQHCAETAEYIHLLFDEVEIEDESWPAEAVAMFELFPDVVLVGGRLHRHDIIVDADRYFGFGQGCESPNRGRTTADPGYFAQMWKPHSASAVPAQHCVARADFLVEALRRVSVAGLGFDNLAMWLGAAARMAGGRVVYSPFFCARSKVEPAEPTALGRNAFLAAYRELIPERRFLSPRLGLRPATAYQILPPPQRRAEEAEVSTESPADYPEQTAADLIMRRIRSPNPIRACGFSLLTSVYERTSAALFEATARSLLTQTVPFREWVVVESGPIPSDVSIALDRLATDSRIRRLRLPENLGIVRPLRHCLEQSAGDWIVPLDHDDLLAPDALQQLALAIEGSPSASFIFSDEDLLIDGKLHAPFRRCGFDAILNAADSTIWHLCAFRRERALELSVYSDIEAEFCHDWDTVCRFAAAGDEFLHVPLVLYHWRRHAGSTSHSGALNRGSLASAKHVMQRTIARQARPEFYEVTPFPLDRGVEQYAIKRRPIDPLPIAAITFGPTVAAAYPGVIERHRFADWRSAGAAARLARLAGDIGAEHVMVLGEALRPGPERGIWEAMRLFEMHSDVAAAAGRIIGANDKVVAYAATPAFGNGAIARSVGSDRSDPGSYAMALKPQTATRLAGEYFFCRTGLLGEAAAALASEDASLERLGERLTSLITERGLRIAYSPLIEADLLAAQEKGSQQGRAAPTGEREARRQ